jgi:hypothetical protein
MSAHFLDVPAATAVNGLIALTAMIAATAWLRSAALSLGWAPPHGPDWLDRFLDMISSRSKVWNAIAAIFALIAAFLQGVAFALSR